MNYILQRKYKKLEELLGEKETKKLLLEFIGDELEDFINDIIFSEKKLEKEFKDFKPASYFNITTPLDNSKHSISSPEELLEFLEKIKSSIKVEKSIYTDICDLQSLIENYKRLFDSVLEISDENNNTYSISELNEINEKLLMDGIKEMLEAALGKC